jgi:TonB-dependent starch-binding outer membrane protein SusC
MVRRMPLFAIALVALLLPLELAAQSAIVTGTVRNQSMAPVRGAAVNIPALNLGSVTNDAGFYRIVVPEARVEGQQITVTAALIGYRAAEATATLTPGVVRVDITMVEQAIALDEILVTGTAGRQARRAQSAVVASINAAELTETAPVSSMSQILQSRMPGVSVQQAGGTVGGTQVIRIRGQSSLSLSNEPLVFIDGVRMDQRTQNVFEVGGQRQSRLNDIRPEDIEDIQVVKGPAAATLYGADASAGVINIITKRGREGAGFTQSVSFENQTHSWDHFTPEDNFGACGAAHVANPNHRVCAGQPVGTVVQDNPLMRTNSLLDGHRRSLNWSGRGGGENHGFYLSLGGHDEAGAFANNRGEGISGRANFDFQPTPNLRIDAGMGVSRTRHQIPRNDNNIYGWLGGSMLGSPLSAGHDARDGWYAPNRGPDALTAQDYTTTTLRTQPRLQLNYSPLSWMTNRVVFGADITRLESRNFFPKNDNFWFAGVLNDGQIGQQRNNYDRLTFDYLGNISTFLTEAVSSDISFGAQILHTRSDWTGATGIGLTTNAARDINRAAQNTGSQSFSESRQLGFMGQWQVGYADRIYVQVAGRVDQHSAFGLDAEPYFSPKAGISWVVSDEPFWQRSMPEFVSAFRVRAAYGTTGRSPVDGNLATYTTGAFALVDGSVGAGVVAENPGNVLLAPERGTEFEAGFEMSLFQDRLGLEFTYFDQNTRDAILNRPLPASQGFQQARRENIGEVMNRGLEFAADARLITLPNFGWQARLGMNSLKSEIVDLGGTAPFWSGWWQRVEEGYEPNAFFTQNIIGYEYDDQGNAIRGIVTDDDVWVGNYMPDFEGNFANTFTLFRDITIYGLLDWKQNFMINNNTSRFRDLSFGTSEAAVRCGLATNPTTREQRGCHLSNEERINRFGPFVNESGRPVSHALVNSNYIEDGSFVRLREVSVSYRIPTGLTQRLGASNATLSAGGRNLALWTDYSLADPEVGLYLHADNRDDFLTLPQARSYFFRLNFQF